MAAAGSDVGTGGVATTYGSGSRDSIPNERKGYRLTLWISATTAEGLADAHGLLQLDGADPVPFCRIEGVPNPLARALQEAYMAVERVRAKPPRMTQPKAAGSPSAPPPAGAAPQSMTPAAPTLQTAQQPPVDGSAPLRLKETPGQPSLF